MRVKITVEYNNEASDYWYCNEPDIDSAIAALGSLQRSIKHYINISKIQNPPF